MIPTIVAIEDVITVLRGDKAALLAESQMNRWKSPRESDFLVRNEFFDEFELNSKRSSFSIRILHNTETFCLIGQKQNKIINK